MAKPAQPTRPAVRFARLTSNRIHAPLSGRVADLDLGKSFMRPELIFDAALSAFLAAEGPALLTDVSERNTCGRLAVYLERQMIKEDLRGYYADPEYNRKKHGRVKTIIDDQFEVIPITTDLIVHSRGEKSPPHDNLIAIEAKKSSRPDQEKVEDKKRLRAMTKPLTDVVGWDGVHPEHVCGYAVGVFVEIDMEKRLLRLDYFKKGERTNGREEKF